MLDIGKQSISFNIETVNIDIATINIDIGPINFDIGTIKYIAIYIISLKLILTFFFSSSMHVVD